MIRYEIHNHWTVSRKRDGDDGVVTLREAAGDIIIVGTKLSYSN